MSAILRHSYLNKIERYLGSAGYRSRHAEVKREEAKVPRRDCSQVD